MLEVEAALHEMMATIPEDTGLLFNLVLFTIVMRKWREAAKAKMRIDEIAAQGTDDADFENRLKLFEEEPIYNAEKHELDKWIAIIKEQNEASKKAQPEFVNSNPRLRGARL